MIDDRLSLPFTIPDLYHGLAHAIGRLRLDQEGIVLEYRIADAVLGILKSRVHETHIPFDEIESIQFKNGWFRKRIFIQTYSLHSQAAIPGGDDGVIRLKVTRHDKERALEVISRINLHISESRLERMDNWPETI